MRRDQTLVQAKALLGADEPLHFDFETHGTNAHDYAHYVGLVGLANSRGVVTCDTRDWRAEEWTEFSDWLQHCGAWAFNAMFDGAWWYRYAPAHYRQDLNLLGCSMVYFKLLACDGHPGDSHSLESLVTSVLGWSTHKDVIPELLTKHGIFKQCPGERRPELAAGTPDKGRMLELLDLEPEPFQNYCGWDADASWQAVQWFDQEVERLKAPMTRTYATEEWPAMILSMIEAQHGGLLLDRPALLALREQTTQDVAEAYAEFRQHPRVKAAIDEWEAAAACEFYKSSWTRKRVVASKAKYQADPDAWAQETLSPKLKYPPWMQDLGFRPVQLEWTERRKNAGKPAPRFNLDSPDQLRWLFYERLYTAEFIPPRSDYFSGDYRVTLAPGDQVTVPATKAGNAPTGKDILPALGDIGQLLGRYSKATKLLEYLDAYVERSAATGRIHPHFRAHGTLTGRQSGGLSEGEESGAKANVQQLTKDKRLLACFIADPNQCLVDYDFPSLEPRVQAQFSRDPTLWELYGMGKEHDVYMFLASRISEQAAAVRAVYEAQGHKAARAAFPELRPPFKEVQLAAGYKAGWRKIYQTMRIKGIKVTEAQVREMHRRYWELFGGVKQWEAQLLAERDDRGGWVYDGRGCVLPIAETKTKDIVNTFTQNTGHKLLLTLNYYVRKLRRDRGVPMRPWLPDTHDQITWQVPAEHAEAARQLVDDAVQALNDELKSAIPFPGGAELGQTFADFKD